MDSQKKPLNGFRLMAQFPVVNATEDLVIAYVVVVDRAALPYSAVPMRDRYVVAVTSDPTAHEWDYSVTYHNRLIDAVVAGSEYSAKRQAHYSADVLATSWPTPATAPATVQ